MTLADRTRRALRSLAWGGQAAFQTLDFRSRVNMKHERTAGVDAIRDINRHSEHCVKSVIMCTCVYTRWTPCAMAGGAIFGWALFEVIVAGFRLPRKFVFAMMPVRYTLYVCLPKKKTRMG